MSDSFSVRPLTPQSTRQLGQVRRLRSGRTETSPPSQRIPDGTLLISTSRRCLTQCARCMTRSEPMSREPLLSSAQARQWAAQLPRLREQGLAHITFAGGEPMRAIDAVAILSAAATQAGIACDIVTSGAWAIQPTMTARLLRRLPGIAHWHIAHEATGADSLPRQSLRNLIDALESLASPYTLRVGPSADSIATQALLDDVAALIGPLGRSTTQPMQRPAALFVAADGITGRCNAGQASQSQGRHPFEFGDASQSDGLVDAWRQWRAFRARVGQTAIFSNLTTSMSP